MERRLEKINLGNLRIFLEFQEFFIGRIELGLILSKKSEF